MADGTAMEARFDHVDDAGRLVFAADGRMYAVVVDETLERAVLAARQTAAERMPSPRPQPTLPISRIQSMIRAGASPAETAARYGLDEALVRRFSAAVQTERQYAVDQFLKVAAPKGSPARTVGDLVDLTMSALRVRRADVQWGATRRGHEPWRVTAKFVVAGRHVKAEWSWDMHDNAIVCLNAAARKLIGEQSLGVLGANLPADGAMLEPGSFGEGLALPLSGPQEEDDLPDTLDAEDSPIAPVSPGSPTSAAAAAPVPAAVPPSVGTAADGPAAAVPAVPSLPSSPVVPAPEKDAEDTADATENPDAADVSDATPSDADRPHAGDSPRDGAATRDGDDAGRDDGGRHRTHRRRSGRSAIPSWDEILFGE